MSHRIDITVSDALYDAIMERARQQGLANERDGGRRVIVVCAVRYWLSKMRFPVNQLDMTDAEYAEARAIAGRPVPSTRKG